MPPRSFESFIQDLVYNVDTDTGFVFRLIKAALFVLLVLLVMLLYTATQFHGLHEAEAMEYAQLGRNLLLTGNLTTQVRAIADVSTAVTEGDLTRQITVEAQGELAELKDRINEMIANLQTSVEETQKYKNEIVKLSESLSELNNVYGNMLSAMSIRKK